MKPNWRGANLCVSRSLDRAAKKMKRYCILDGDECALVEEKLDEAGIDYDWGPLDRLIVENDEDCDEVEDILDECDIAYGAV